MAISDWPEGERPRERLLQQGAESLSDAELLAIFLRTGIRGKSAVDLGRDILSRFGSLNQIFHATATECIAVPGLGIAKYTQLQAILEMAKRALSEQLSLRELMTSPQAVRDYLRLSLGNLPHEVFLALWLDAQNRLILSEELFRGTLTQASVYPREVVKRALHHNAAAVIFAHNHPSGFTEASAADKTLTQALKNALKLIDVKLLDHFIIVNGKAPSSMAEQGLIG